VRVLVGVLITEVALFVSFLMLPSGVVMVALDTTHLTPASDGASSTEGYCATGKTLDTSELNSEEYSTVKIFLSIDFLVRFELANTIMTSAIQCIVQRE
jgi:hypothetical protein